MKLTSVLCAIALVAACPAAAAEVPRGGGCDVTGVWYGGSGVESPYLAAFSPTASGASALARPDRYSAEYKLAADLVPLGVASWTGWHGEVFRTGPRRFEVYVIAYFVLTPEGAAASGVDGTLPELQAVHSVVEMSEDCAVMTNTVDRYDDILAFDSSTMVPFVTPPDFEWISEAGGPIVETYRRMPTLLGTLPVGRSAADVSRPAASPTRSRGR